MSKIGKQPVIVPEGVTATVTAHEVALENPKGRLVVPLPRGVFAKLEEGAITVTVQGTGKQARSNWGTIRALIENAAVGLTKGYTKVLILEGIGYRVSKEGNDLTLNLGFSHPVKYPAPVGVTFDVEKNSTLSVKGFDKALVGQVAAEIRALKKPEPYKGKGFHYSDEIVRRKAGKKAATGAGASA
jgi:large subunit ribosomal protein L6